MRVSLKLDAAQVAGSLLALTVTLSTACASKAIDDSEPAATPNAGRPSSEPTGGTDSGAPSGGSDTSSGAGPSYQKQDYPAGPYGTGVGATLENFSFLGWRDPVASVYDVSKLERVRLAEYYNPEGRSNVRLILIKASAER